MKLTQPSLNHASAIAMSLMALTGCQSVQPKPATIVTTTTPVTTTTVITPVATVPTNTVPQQFEINGKIGVTTPQQAGSAFYTWGQQGENFAINLAGALNAGQTDISYNGQTATLTNDKGTLTADNPEELLYKATTWQAPISQLPYWIMGQPAPSDKQSDKDSQNRLVNAANGDWAATFDYAGNARLPNRITMRHPDGYKVVMTINRLK